MLIRPPRDMRVLQDEHIKQRLRQMEREHPDYKIGDIVRHFDDEGAPQFYIDYITAFKYVRQFNAGMYDRRKEYKNPYARARMHDFYRIYYDLYLQHLNELSDKEIILKTIESHAPSFYISPHKIQVMWLCL